MSKTKIFYTLNVLCLSGALTGYYFYMNKTKNLNLKELILYHYRKRIIDSEEDRLKLVGNYSFFKQYKEIITHPRFGHARDRFLYSLFIGFFVGIYYSFKLYSKIPQTLNLIKHCRKNKLKIDLISPFGYFPRDPNHSLAFNNILNKHSICNFYSNSNYPNGLSSFVLFELSKIKHPLLYLNFKDYEKFEKLNSSLFTPKPTHSKEETLSEIDGFFLFFQKKIFPDKRLFKDWKSYDTLDCIIRCISYLQPHLTICFDNIDHKSIKQIDFLKIFLNIHSTLPFNFLLISKEPLRLTGFDMLKHQIKSPLSNPQSILPIIAKNKINISNDIDRIFEITDDHIYHFFNIITKLKPSYHPEEIENLIKTEKSLMTEEFFRKSLKFIHSNINPDKKTIPQFIS